VSTVVKFQFERRAEGVYGMELTKIGGRFMLNQMKYIGSIQQKNVRVDVDFSGILTFEIKGVKYGYDIHIKDISSGGFGFHCEENLPMEQIYEYIVDWGIEPIVVNVRLVRKEKINEGGYAYGCCFMDIYPDEEMILRGAVFYIQTKIYHDKRREKK